LWNRTAALSSVVKKECHSSIVMSGLGSVEVSGSYPVDGERTD
jgi:hypothetical protein